jgi:tetratricopeptide (TPR) repeat protein
MPRPEAATAGATREHGVHGLMGMRSAVVVVLGVLSLLAPPRAVAQSTPPASVRSPAEEARRLAATAALRALKQNWEGAEEAARAAIALDKSLADAWHQLASALAKRKEPDEAAAAWEEALLRDPQHLAALEGLGRLYAARGEREKAEALLGRLRPLDDRRAATLHHAIELAGTPADRASASR